MLKENDMELKETWKDIPGYEGRYMASDLGKIKSLNYNHTKTEKVLTPGIDERGRMSVALHKNGKQKSFRVHQLIAISFLNHKPDGTFKIVVDHIDNDQSNNNLDNLQLITNRENTSKDKKNKSSKYTGVTWDKANNKWLAQIKINGRSKFLGRFVNELDAYNAYKNKLSTLF